MKHLRLLLLAMPLLAAGSCEKEGPEETPGEIVFRIDDAKVSDGGMFVPDARYNGYVVLKSNSGDWTAAVEPAEEWITITERKDGESNRLRVEVKENKSFGQRTANLIFKSGAKQLASLKLTQLGSKKTVVVQDKYLSHKLDHEGGTVAFPVVANTAFGVTFDFDGADPWISRITTPVGRSRAVEGEQETLSFKVESLDGADDREALIVLTPEGAEGDDGKVRIAVSQTGVPPVEYPTFVIFSDIHFDRTSGGMEASERLRKLMPFLVEKAGSVDAVFVTGDYSDGGSEAQYDKMLAVLKDPAVVDQSIPFYFAMGNHDHYTSGGSVEAIKLYKKKFGAESIHAYQIIKGYPFISISIDQVDNAAEGRDWYLQSTVDWVVECLKDAVAKCPGKPIFMFTHIPVSGTVPWSSGRNNSSAQFKEILKEYPQAVFFSGHEHTSLVNPRGIWQEDFTAIDCSTAWKATAEGGRLDAWLQEGEYVMEGIVARVLENGDVKIEKWDAHRDEEIAPAWIISAPHDGSAFNYSGRTGGSGPVFTGGAPTIGKISEGGCRVTWTQATDEDKVYYYTVEVYTAADDKLVTSDDVFSCYFYNSGMPPQISYDQTGLTLGKEYYVRIWAYDLFKNKSDGYIQSENFTTREYEPDPGTVAPVADLFDINFTKAGAADRSALANAIETGPTAPVTKFDETAGSYIASFTSAKDDHYKLWYKDAAAIKSALGTAHTMEAYYRIRNNGGSVIGFMQGGGGGYYHVSNKPAYYMYLNSGWTILTANAVMTTTDYYHVVFTYDKTARKMTSYVNGSPAGSCDAVGTLSFPANDAAQFFGIGCDSNVGTVDYPMDGELVFARLYSHVVDEDEVYMLYKQVRDRRRIARLAELIAQLETSLPALEAAATGDDKAAVQETIADGWKTVNSFGSTQKDVDDAIARGKALMGSAGDTGKPGGELGENDLNPGGGPL